MKLPHDAVVANEKLTRHLLTPQTRGDKSGFLALAGYTIDNWGILRDDLRVQILPKEAVLVQKNKFGRMFEISGDLRGPNGSVLRVRTIWITEDLSGITRFVTLPPERRRL